MIIYCAQLELHRSWAQKYQKVLLVTSDSSEVVEQVKRIECGDVYFLTNGFSIEDVTLKLQNTDYYLSSKEHGFMIPDLACINLNLTHHRMIIQQLHKKLLSKNLFSNEIPDHFTLSNLNQCADEFIEALKQAAPEKIS